MTTRKANIQFRGASVEAVFRRLGTILVVLTLGWGATVQAAAPSAAGAGGLDAWVVEAFSEGHGGDVRPLSGEEMDATRGRLALVPFIGLVVGTDLALASFYWGVYVPTVSGGGSTCSYCSTLVSMH